MAETCPHCGHETEADVCPLCGSELAGRGSADRGPAGAAAGHTGGGDDRDPAGPRARRAPDEGRSVPWEDPSLSFPTDLWRTWRESLFSPGRFFGRVDDRGSLARPVLYFLLVSVVGAVFALVWQTVWLSGPGNVYPGGAGGALAHPAVSFFLAPFLALIGLAILTMIYHLGALVLAPDRRGMGGTARVICYAAGPSVLALVPFLGSLAAGVWTLVLQVVGLREVHRTTTGRAVLMVFWLWAVLFVLFVLGAVILALVAGPGMTDAAREGLVGSLFPAG